VSQPAPSHPSRREILGQALRGGAGLVLGLSWWQSTAQAQDGDPGAERALEQALGVMREHGLHGLAVVVPADARGRERLGERLAARIPVMNAHMGIPPAALPFLEAVWVCAPASEVGAQPGETLVLLDPQGRRVAGAAIDFDDAAAFQAGVRELLDGDGRAAARVEAATTPELATAVEQVLESEAGSDEFYRAYSALGESLRSGPAVVQAYLGLAEGSQARSYLGGLLGERYWHMIQQARGLPYGVSWRVEMNEPEPCPPCGMASPSIEGRTFLRFFAP
jgi:hypothetical protein